MNGKKQYVVTIEEMVSQSFNILANSDEEAERLVREKYKNGELVLEPGNLVAKQMELHNLTDNYLIDWVEF